MNIENPHPNGHPSFVDYFWGFLASICMIVYKVIHGFIEHNGGIMEIIYTLMSIAFFGVFGATVSYLWNRFVLKKNKP